MPADDADPAAALGWIGSLAGSCWRGEYAQGGGDTQCYAWQYGRYLRGTIEIETTGRDGSPFRLSGDSVFEFDRRTGRLRYASWSDLGNLRLSEAYYEGDLLHFPDVKSKDEKPSARQTWRRIDPDAYEVSRQRREGEEWKPQLSVVYRRVAPAAASPPQD